MQGLGRLAVMSRGKICYGVKEKVSELKHEILIFDATVLIYSVMYLAFLNMNKIS